MGLFSKNTDEQIFWKWFQKNEAWIYDFEKNQEAILDEISSRLKTYKEGLAFELSSEKNHRREFIISADGIRDLFPNVQALTNAAPKMKKWSIIAFRPRMDNYTQFTLTSSERDLDPKKLWTYHRIEDGHFDLIIYYPDYSDEYRNKFINASYILLDMALGEYDVVTGVRYIDHRKLLENPEEEGLRPFSRLREDFDAYKNSKAEQSAAADQSGQSGTLFNN